MFLYATYGFIYPKNKIGHPNIIIFHLYSKGKIASICKVLVYKLISSGNHSTRSLVTPKKSFKQNTLGKKFYSRFRVGGFIGTQGVIGKKNSDFYMIEVYLYVFLGWEIDWCMRKFVKMTRNHVFCHFWPKILIFWPKKKISDFYMIGVYLYVFWDGKLIGACENS